VPDLGFLTRDFATALRSFFETVDRITADNPVAVARLQELAGKARLGQLSEADVDGAAVRDVLERNQEFTVEPYGVEMMKVMSPLHNGGFSTFILSTDDNTVYEPDKRLLSAACTRDDAGRVTNLAHEDCVRRGHRRLSRSRRRVPPPRRTVGRFPPVLSCSLLTDPR
jgi:hypothetical protein